MATIPRIGKNRPAQRRRAPVNTDPFAAQSPGEIQRTIGGYTKMLPHGPTPQQIRQQVQQARAGLPAPLSQAQIQTRAQGMLDPVIQRITQNINQQTAGQQQAVTGYTNQLAQNLARIAPTLVQPYQQGEAAVSASNQSLADRLAGGGQQAGQDLQQRLASINAPGAVDPAVAAAQQAGTGAGNSLYASGNAALQELISNAANAAGYGAKLPGIARLGGLQQAGLVGQQGATNLAQGISQAEGQLPGIVGSLQQMSEQRATNRSDLASQLRQSLTGQASDAQTNRAKLASDLYQTLTGQNITRAVGEAGLAEKQAAASAPQIVGSSGTGYYSLNPSTGQSSQVVPAAPRPKPTPRAKPADKVIGSDKTGRYLVDPTTGQKTLITPAVKPTPAQKKKDQGPQLTAASAQKYRGIAATIAENARHGFTIPAPAPTAANPNPQPTPHPAINYTQALNEMLKAGVPQNIAIQALNRWYPATARSVNPSVNPAAAGPPNPAFG